MNQALPDPGKLTILLIFGAPFVVGALWIVVHAVTTVINNWRDVGLKSRMIDLGMSAEEIERVINAGRGEAAPSAPQKPVKKGGDFAYSK